MRFVNVATLVFVGIVLSLDSVNAEEQPASCSAVEASQFDFGVGEWSLTWADSGRGTNTITKDYDGCDIRENCTSLDDAPLRGLSVSVYVPNSGKWHQTWVDNQGSCLDFAGEYKDGKMILSRTARPKGKSAFLQLMVWYNIAVNSFKWNWERSDDDGENWKAVWAIDYVRR